MPVYELINPSDKITFEADSDQVAAAITIVIGSGAYGAVDAGGASACPLMLFGSAEEIQASIRQLLGCDLGPFIRDHMDACCRALESFASVSLSDRAALMAALGDAGPEALSRWNEQKRTSMNRICAHAEQQAARWREQLDEWGEANEGSSEGQASC